MIPIHLRQHGFFLFSLSALVMVGRLKYLHRRGNFAQPQLNSPYLIGRLGYHKVRGPSSIHPNFSLASHPIHIHATVGFQSYMIKLAYVFRCLYTSWQL